MRKALCIIFAAAVITALVPLSAANAAAPAEDNGAQVAEETPPPLPRIIPPPPPEALTKGEEIKPSVRIVHREGAVFRQFSINGRIYAIKIIPRWGPPYWLYDSDGDGILDEMGGNPLYRVPQVVEWNILTW